MKTESEIDAIVKYIINYKNHLEQNIIARQSFRKALEILQENPLANPIVLVKESKINQVIDELQKKIEFLEAPENRETIGQFIDNSWSSTQQIEKNNIVSRSRLITWCKKAIEHLNQRKYAIMERLLERTAGTRVDEIAHKDFLRLITEKPIPYKIRDNEKVVN